MSDLLAVLSATPRLYPQNFDPASDSMFLMEMSEADYRRASFLDDRMLSAETRGQWVPCDAVARALPAPAADRPLHFIFHSGHVGSTLLSRLLDETAKVLSLREPLPLRTFAVAFDAPFGEGRLRLEARLETFLRLWERGFAATEAVILKATSSAARLAPRLLTARPAARAVCLNLSSESYLAALLRSANSAVDLSAHGTERTARLERRLGAPLPRPASPGELAALSWLAERLTQDEIGKTFGGRVLAVDFEAFLRMTGPWLARILAHFGLAIDAERLAAIIGSAVLSRYSKAPEHGFSPALRDEILAQVRTERGDEIRKGLDWLSALSARHPSVAAVL